MNELLKKCMICPHKCGINRFNTTGKCNSSDQIKINLSQLHYGEEPILSGTQGSGTIFFSNCNLKCVFCQNYLISDLGEGTLYSIAELSDIMISLQKKNAHNINLVTPSHYTPQIIEAIKSAKSNGFTIPIIWNSNGYEEVSTLKLLDGLIDIYLPDFKYFNSDIANKYSGIKNYTEKVKLAIKEMYWQKGDLKIKNGIAQSGVMIRLLNLPENLNSIELILEWIYKNFGNEIFLSLMSQYYPTHKASEFKEINRGITFAEFQFASKQFEKYGFHNGFIQEITSSNEYTPNFKTSSN